MTKLYIVALICIFVVLCLFDTNNASRRRRAPPPRPPPKINCAVSQWTSWGRCSRSCGTGGSYSRTRRVTTHPSHGGRACPSLSQTKPCFMQNCPIDCSWTSWGAWSPCDAFSAERSRYRNISIAEMFGGKPCLGSDFEVNRECPKPKIFPVTCPSGYFNCSDGLTCIRYGLRCNGDDDCTDNSDERCKETIYPCGNKTFSAIPNIDLAGAGFDITTAVSNGQILDNQRYNGRCAKVLSGDHLQTFRQPANIQYYRFQVSVDTSFTTRSYDSSKDYVEEQRRETDTKITASVSAGFFFGGVSVKSSYSNNKYTKYVIKESSNEDAKFFKVTNTVKLAQFSTVRGNNVLTSHFRRRLHELPDHYDYQKYLEVISDYGTHFYSSGILGGKYEYIYRYSKTDLKKSKLSESGQKKCLSVEASAKFFKIGTSAGTTVCSSNSLSKQNGNSFTKSAQEEISKIVGGESSSAARLSFNHQVESNEKDYSAWIETVKNNPSMIDYQLTLISEVIPDPVKRQNMDRALFHYMAKYDTAVCIGKCYNGADVFVTDGGASCTCLCKPSYTGVDCSHTSINL